MTYSLQVGDRVEIFKGDRLVGNHGTIHHFGNQYQQGSTIYQQGSTIYLVDIDDPITNAYVFTKDVRQVKDKKPKFKVGDWVKIKSGEWRNHYGTIQSIGFGWKETLTIIEFGWKETLTIIEFGWQKETLTIKEINLEKVNEKEMPFKLGDKVQFKSTGNSGIVNRIYTNSDGKLCFQILTSQNAIAYNTHDDLEKIPNEQPKFKVEDRVQVNEPNNHSYLHGKKGTIDKYDGDKFYEVKIDDHKYFYGLWEENLVKIEEEEKQFKIGDKVEIKNWYNSICNGKIGIIVGNIWANSEDLKKISPRKQSPKFKVGDRVAVITSAPSPFKITGEIVEYDNKLSRYTVKYDLPTLSKVFYCSEKSLQKLPDEQTTKNNSLPSQTKNRISIFNHQTNEIRYGTVDELEKLANKDIQSTVQSSWLRKIASFFTLPTIVAVVEWILFECFLSK